MVKVADAVLLRREGRYKNTIWFVRSVNRLNETCNLWHPQIKGILLSVNFSEIEQAD
jgi:hypothetical protein